MVKSFKFFIILFLLDKIKTNNELNLNISSKKIKNKVDLTIKKEDLFDPLSIIAKNNNTKNDEKIKFDNSTSLNKTKKFNLFDDEDDKPAKDKAEDLFKLPGKRNTKILGFLDENDTEDPLTELKKNKTTAGRNEKVIFIIYYLLKNSKNNFIIYIT